MLESPNYSFVLLRHLDQYEQMATMNVIKENWASRLIRTPDGAAYRYRYRYRYRFCMCGCQQEYGINYFDMFAPLIQWGTIQLMLIFILTQN